ncbi:MAG: hypothetical protein LAT55_13790 [Opitutales bacterium]|nr:hypothetical protein [Opitutales bacterium]
MPIRSRSDLKEYCLRKLGKPVIEINVADIQIEDRIDEAIEYYIEYHAESTREYYYKHQLTEEDHERGYIEIPDSIISVSRVVPMSTSLFHNSFLGWADTVLHEIVHAGGLTNMYMTQNYLAEIDFHLRNVPDARFSRMENRLHFDKNDRTFETGYYLIFEVQEIIDPKDFPKIYDDWLLKRHATQLIKQQWGANLSKYENIELIGGKTLNGRQMYDEATQEIERLEEKYVDLVGEPAGFFKG